MEFVACNEYEKSTQIIKSEMRSYYSDNALVWDDESKLALYRQCKLWIIRAAEDIGFAMTRESGAHFYLAELHIESKYRNQGYGARALQLASALAASLGYEEIRVRVFKNNPAHQLYLRSGYKLEKELPYTYQLVAITNDR
ncbi:MAG TPA: GNAT family N-acetyltransferase [Spongiibacteraceae bacterium]|nr:GNAT family N-acetyltransferase [Spongiibacteraceae bacterium]